MENSMTGVLIMICPIIIAMRFGSVLQGGIYLLIGIGKLCWLQLGVKKMQGKFSSLPRVGPMEVMEQMRLDSTRCREVTKIVGCVLRPLQI